MIARLVDGRTALHIAAARGNAPMVKALMNQSLANEEEEAEKQEARRDARRAERKAKGEITDSDKGEGEEDANSEASEITLESEEASDSMTMGSFVKVDNEKKEEVSISIGPLPVDLSTFLTHSNIEGRS
jgi:ankyrin repeat protein